MVSKDTGEGKSFQLPEIWEGSLITYFMKNEKQSAVNVNRKIDTIVNGLAFGQESGKKQMGGKSLGRSIWLHLHTKREVLGIGEGHQKDATAG